MKRITSLAFFFCSICLLIFTNACAQLPKAAVSSSKTIDSLADLQKQLKAHIEQSRFEHCQWGIKVVSLDTGKILFGQNPDKEMKPASNAKMYTGSLALDRLGPDYRIKTSFYADAKPSEDGTIRGDLIVYGRGDPTFSWRFNDKDYSKALKPAIDALLAAGVKKIEGDLIGDDSFFRGQPFGTDWAADDLQQWYGALASALSVQDNVIDLVFKPGKKVGAPCEIITKPPTTFMKFDNRTETISRGSKGSVELYRPLGENTAYVWGKVPMGGSVEDSVSVHNPALWFVTLLREELAKHGVTVSGNVRSVNWLEREIHPLDSAKLVEVASVESRPMSEIVKGMMKPSQNLYAHLLLLQVGEKFRDPKRKTQWSESAGIAEMNKFMGEIGVDKGTVLLEEGSGLSRGCLVTPSSSVKLLTHMSKHRCAEIFRDALPIAGVDGTLKSRFKGTFAEKNVHAKTGTIEFVNTISGYVTTRGGEHLVFSVMLNNYHPPSQKYSGRADADEVVRMLAEFTGNLAKSE